MATTYKEVVTTGPIEWARLSEEGRDMTGYEGMYVDCDGAYTLNQILSKEELAKLKAAGSQKKPKQSRLMDGEIVIKFERKHKVTKADGTVIEKAGGPPTVVNAQGKPWDWSEDGLIGNGSLAQVTNLVSTFEYTDKEGKTQKTSRTSLTKVKILSLVEYEKPEDDGNEFDDEIGF